MSRLTKRGFIGKDYIIQDRVHKVYNMKRNLELPTHRFFQCQNEFCSEIIQGMECSPTCHGTKFNRANGKILIFNRNEVITAKCKDRKFKNAILHCTEFSFQNGDTIDLKDCVTGKYVNEASAGSTLDFRSLQNYFRNESTNLKGFSDYKDLVIHPNVK